MTSDRIVDAYLDDLARAMVPGCAYEAKTGCVLYVIKVDHGSLPGEFASGRRPAQAKIVVLSSPTGHFREGSLHWLHGRNIEWLVPKVIA